MQLKIAGLASGALARVIGCRTQYCVFRVHCSELVVAGRYQFCKNQLAGDGGHPMIQKGAQRLKVDAVVDSVVYVFTTRVSSPIQPSIGMRELICLALSASLGYATYIVPGAQWQDTSGNLVNAHAGGVNYDDLTKKFWLFGEYKIEGHTEGGGVRVYSSKDLAKWVDHGLALAPIEGHSVIDPSMVIQRPKVAYAESTGKFNVSHLSLIIVCTCIDH